jgi:hypothetical protein
MFMALLCSSTWFHLDSLRKRADLSVHPQMAADQANGDQVMFTTANGPRGQANLEGHVPTKTMRAAALLGTLILVSIAVNALIIVADRSLRQPDSIAEHAR